jgi:TonB family protein
MKLLYASVATLFVAAAAQAAAEAQSAVAVDLYQGPKGIDVPLPTYPVSERRDRAEGWVIVNFMIDRQGKPYELSVADSTGNHVLEQAALEQVQKWRFEPATLNGKPVDAGDHVKMEFVLTNIKRGTSFHFGNLYQQAVKAIEAGDQKTADGKLALLKPYNLSEDAWLGVVQYMYCRKWCTGWRQLTALRRAVADEKTPRFLPQPILVSMLEAEVALELGLQDYAQALRTWDTLNALGLDEATRAKWQGAIDEIETLRTNDKAYAVMGEFGDQSSWFFEPLKRKFQVEVLTGSIAEIKLRCARQYVFFRFDPTVQYTIADDDQACSMEMVGQPGTKFRLTQM